MEVILTQDVDALGMAGQVVDVAQGYARNKLIPAKLAVQATPANLKRLEKQRAEYEIRAMKEVERARQLAEEIEALRLTITQKAGEKGKLYGSVTTMDLGSALAEQGLDIDRRKIKLSEPIKTLGEFDVSVKLHSEVIANLKVTVEQAE